MAGEITLKNINAVLAFLPLFEDKQAEFYEIQTEPLTLDPYFYSAEVERFIQVLYGEEFIVSFNWPGWQNEAQRFIANPKRLDLADLSILQKLLTTHVRKERFCSGHLASMIENGYILGILKRLEMIRAEMIAANIQEKDKSNPLERIAVIKGDITQLKVDAIANAANESLLGGGGVDGAIHRAAGPGLLAECRQLKGCATGEAKMTSGYNLPARWVIHTVGPVWQGGSYGEDELLAQCYRNCLALAEQYSIRTIAFPAISAGVYGFPMERASKIAVTEVKSFLEKNSSTKQVILVCFGEEAYDFYSTALKEIVGA